MDNVIYELEAGMLNIKLTGEKIIAVTPKSKESFALRSLSGIGVIDLLEEFNNSLSEKKIYTPLMIISIAVCGFVTYAGFIFLKLATFIGIPLIVVGFLCLIISIIKLNQLLHHPKLMSAVRIFISGENRDFILSKADIKIGDLDEFVSVFESTLKEHFKHQE